MSGEKIFEGIYLVGSADLTEEKDCCVYLLEFPNELVLIDSGAGESGSLILQNVKALGLDPSRIKKLILTHCHLDHIGGANEFKSSLGLQIIAHKNCADILLRADPVLTAAKWYGLAPETIVVDQTFDAPEMILEIDQEKLHLLYIPGHSPDSIAVYMDRRGRRILFGQDVHGPIHPALGSDRKLYQESLRKLIGLKPDLLCEGHFGIYQPNAAAEKYLRSYLS
jgi:glyoxylase-like metal-dependent hydrolase (beta-lactamase superfamily II)